MTKPKKQTTPPPMPAIPEPEAVDSQPAAADLPPIPEPGRLVDVEARAEAYPEPVDLRLPIGVVTPGGYCQRHVDVQLNSSQGATMRSLLVGLQREGAHLANFRPVVTPADVVRWILESVQ